MSQDRFQAEVMDELRMLEDAWLPLEKIKPVSGTIVMTYGYGVAGSEMCQAYYKDGKWQELDECGDFFDYPPTHWQSMPAPPKE